jgi:glutathione synthase
MNHFKHLFIVDPIETLNLALDSSLRMAFELTRRGHGVALADARHLERRSSSSGSEVLAQQTEFPNGPTAPVLAPARRQLLSDFSAVHMRKDPPWDLDYVATTWLLDGCGEQTKVYNSPEALRSLNEKLAIFLYPEDIKPALASAKPEELLRFIKTEAKGDAVIKPLSLFGGRGVQRLQVSAMGEQNLLALLNTETNHGQALRLVQPFDPKISEGEVRAFAVGGKALAWCLKKPASGEFLANTRAGATLHRYNPSPDVKDRVERLARDLERRGAPIVGFDLIGGFVSEINLTSPRLLQAPDDTTNYYAEFARWVEQDLRSFNSERQS